MSKLLEKLFYNKLITFIKERNVLHNNQFGFRAKIQHHLHLSTFYVLVDKRNDTENIVLVFALFDFIHI